MRNKPSDVMFTCSRMKLVVSRRTRGKRVVPLLVCGNGLRAANARRPLAYGAKMSSEMRRSVRYVDGGIRRFSIGM
jgi:hypothetical protein